jgi:hypothetical protein
LTNVDLSELAVFHGPDCLQHSRPFGHAIRLAEVEEQGVDVHVPFDRQIVQQNRGVEPSRYED